MGYAVAMKRLLVLLVGCGSPYTDISRPDDAPTASILSPSEGVEVPSGRIELLGRVGDDVDPAERVYVTWSLATAEGAWVEVCSGFASPDGTTLCIAEVAVETVRIRLIAQDVPGFQRSVVLPLQVRAVEAPEVELVRPGVADRLYANVPVRVEALLSDVDDDTSVLEVRWESSITGRIEGPTRVDRDGRVVGTLQLPFGEQELRVSVTDPDGATNVAARRVFVGEANEAPRVRFEAPEVGLAVEEGAYAEVRVVALDDVTDEEDLQVSITSDLDGTLPPLQYEGNGRHRLETDALRLGTHTLTLTAIDDAGTEGQATRVLVVDEPPELVITSPVEGGIYTYAAGIPVRARATDDLPGLAFVDISATTSLITGTILTPGTPEGTYEATLRALRGEQQVTVVATDGYGLVTTRTVRVTVQD